jgi:amino acid transporter
MTQKKVGIVAIVLLGIVTLFFVVRGKLDFAILTMMALFTLTNASRAKSFKEQGFERESRWMRYLSILFAISFVVVLLLIIL